LLIKIEIKTRMDQDARGTCDINLVSIKIYSCVALMYAASNDNALTQSLIVSQIQPDCTIGIQFKTKKQE
jgi:hypothetical protein